MVEYFCPCCDYETYDISLFIRHYFNHGPKIIYMIICNCKKKYIGSTTIFDYRLHEHKRDNQQPLHSHLKNCGNKFEYKILEEDVWDYLYYENFYVEKYNTVENGLNEYYPIFNNERCKKYKSKWYNENKDRILTERAKYYKDNTEIFKKRRKRYYENNKQKRAEKILCDCGSMVRSDYLIKHKKTNKHLNNIQS